MAERAGTAASETPPYRLPEGVTAFHALLRNEGRGRSRSGSSSSVKVECMTTPSFSLMSRQQVLGVLKATGSTDTDVLAAAKAELVQPMKFLKFMGLWAYVTGGLATVLILTAIIGLPLLIFGWWVRRRAATNLATIDATYDEYLQSIGAELPAAV